MTPFDCPRCGSTLTMSERHGIEIDYCPQCRGVWLDRGELDKIIERVAVAEAPPPRPAAPPPPQPSGWTQSPSPQPGYQQPAYQQPPPGWAGQRDGGRPYKRDDDDWDDDKRRSYGKPRKNWLSELFD